MKTSQDYFEQIDEVLTRLEQYKPTTKTLDWCAHRIDWCWRWRKISKEQMEQLADRVIKLYERK